MATSRLTSIAAIRQDFPYIHITLDSSDLPLIAALSDSFDDHSFSYNARRERLELIEAFFSYSTVRMRMEFSFFFSDSRQAGVSLRLCELVVSVSRFRGGAVSLQSDDSVTSHGLRSPDK